MKHEVFVRLSWAVAVSDDMEWNGEFTLAREVSAPEGRSMTN